jgi:hypothetical protein
VIEQAIYRARQFFRALTASLAEEDLGEAEQALTRAQWTLFLRLPPSDRRHAVAVYRALQEHTSAPGDLLVAALLHDVGKAAAPMPLWARVMVVLLERFAPRLLSRLCRDEGPGWRGSFVVYRLHAEAGADMAAQAGCSPLAVTLIRRHHEPVRCRQAEEDRLLALLQEADGNW